MVGSVLVSQPVRLLKNEWPALMQEHLGTGCKGTLDWGVT